MEKTKTRRAAERPTATKVEEPVAVQETMVMEQPKEQTPKTKPAAKKRTIKRQQKEVNNCEFNVVKGGGIVLMLPQKA